MRTRTTLLCMLLSSNLCLQAQQADSITFVKTLDSVLSVATKMLNRGKYNDTKECLINFKSSTTPQTALDHKGMGRLYITLGGACLQLFELEEAEKYLMESYKIYTRYGFSLPIQYYLNVGTLQGAQGQLKLAENTYDRFREFLESSPLRDSLMPIYYINISNLYFQTNRYENALKMLLKAKETLENRPGMAQSRYYFICIGNLGAVYDALDSLDKAIAFLKKSAELRKGTVGEKHQHYLSALNNLALIKIKSGALIEAKNLLLENIPRFRASPNRELYAAALTNLGDIYIKTGNLDSAFILNGRAIQIRDSLYQKKHFFYLYNLTRLFQICALKGNKDCATVLNDVDQIEHTLLTEAATYQHEAELSEAVSRYKKERDKRYSILWKINIQPHVPQLYQSVLFHKGFLLQHTTALNRFAHAADDSIKTLFYRWKSINRRLAKEHEKPVAERKGTEMMEAEAQRFEKMLVERSAEFGSARQQVSWQQVREALRPGEAALEFIQFRYHNGIDWTDSVLYCALVLRPRDKQPRLVYLFEEAQLQDLLNTGTNRIQEHLAALYGTRSSIYDLVWRPLDTLLKGARRVWYAPDGLLHRLSFAALPIPNTNQRLTDRYEVQLVNSTRELVTGGAPLRASEVKNALLYGGIRYDTTELPLRQSLERLDGVRPEANTDVALTSGCAWCPRGDSIRGNFLDLPGTLVETLTVDSLLKTQKIKTRLLSGTDALEESFIRLGTQESSPGVLHVATHGFFWPPTLPLGRNYERAYRFADNPMFRSGLAFAGARRQASGLPPLKGMEDGMLYAWDVSDLPLFNTQLVVLSACETALGDVQDGEGVYGLQRAFRLAGARHVLMSLWKVDDQATAEFMADFYRVWLSGHDIRDAFHSAQKTMRAKYDKPYYWAGFVLM